VTSRVTWIDQLPSDTLPGYRSEATQEDGAVFGYGETKDVYRKRLRRIEGQIRGLEAMIDDDRYCIDILTQISAATRALQSVALALVDDHLSHCVREAIDAGGPEADAKVAEASAAIARLVRS
jgi:DNA-binding FrmR family transcriptional regulator